MDQWDIPQVPCPATPHVNLNHFLVDSEAASDRTGTRLVPVGQWGPWRESLDPSGASGGRTRLPMSQLAPGGQITAGVNPFALLGLSGTRILVSANDHFAGDGATPEVADSLTEVLGQEVSPSQERSEGDRGPIHVTGKAHERMIVQCHN